MHGGDDRPLVLVHGELKSPPFSVEARRRAGFLLRRLQHGLSIAMPDSRPMSIGGPRCHELRVNDPAARQTWRIFYRLDPGAVVVVDLFSKKTRPTPAAGRDGGAAWPATMREGGRRGKR